MVLIVAKCIVNYLFLKDGLEFLYVLIVAKCIVNECSPLIAPLCLLY